MNWAKDRLLDKASENTRNRGTRKPVTPTQPYLVGACYKLSLAWSTKGLCES